MNNQHFVKLINKVNNEIKKNNFDKDDMKNRGKVGLKNLGNTCYINSASQCLSHTIELRDYFLKGEYRKYQNKKHPSSVLVDEWKDMLSRMWHKDTHIEKKGRTFGVEPGSYVSNVRNISMKNEGFSMFGGFAQNDSQEYLGFFMNQLHDVLEKKILVTINGTPNNGIEELIFKAYANWKLHFENSYSKFVDIFYGQIMNIIECPETGEKNFSFEPLGTLPLSLPLHTADNQLTLEKCFRYYTRHSNLEGDNAWQSAKTGKKHKAYRYTRFWQLPKYMIVILKRFDMSGKKRNDNIIFPEILDMQDFCIVERKQTSYRLYGTINHYGSIFGGHYTAHCRNHEQWRSFDDMNVEDIELEDVLSEHRSAYVLFYEKLNN